MPPLRPPALFQDESVRDRPEDIAAALRDILPDPPYARRLQDTHGLGVDPRLPALLRSHSRDAARRLHMKPLQRTEFVWWGDPGLTAVEQDRGDDCLVEHARNRRGYGVLSDDRGDAVPHLPRPLECPTDGLL